MTFYNIVFGLLFIGAFREVIWALSRGPDWQLFCLAATLSVLVFSDTIYTSVVIEDKKKNYSIGMRLLDLCSFILLSFAVVILNPETNDMFEVNVTGVLQRVVSGTGLSPEALFWGLLTLYMAMLFIWNLCLGVGQVHLRHRLVVLVQPAFVVVFATMAVLAWCAADPYHGRSVVLVEVLACLRWVVLVAVLAYLLRFKKYLSDILDKVITLESLTDSDVTAIRQWPPYQKPLDVFNYALHPGGWLDNPDSETNFRYGIWQHGKLIGFSLLTDVKSGEAEFYIALNAAHIGKKIGREATVQTIRRGFGQHRLNRIHLKVRDWHHSAQRGYASVGFQECGKVQEPVEGELVDFVRMQLSKDRWQPRVDYFRALIRSAPSADL